MTTKFTMLAACSIAASLIACQRQEPTRTVEWYVAHPKDTETVLVACRNNPGELAATPNCINANKAKNKTTWGAQGRGIVLDGNGKGGVR